MPKPASCNGLVNSTGLQSDLFQPATHPKIGNEQSERLMAVMDRVNRQSKTKIVIARNAGAAAYTMRREHLSPAYTTDWENLQLVR
jgi:DNA polymerase V